MRNETQADIAREMRTYFQAQKRNGYPEHRPWHQVLSDWADRIDAAYARDIGNVSAMRAALGDIRDYALQISDKTGEADVASDADSIADICAAALSAPPRKAIG